MFLLHISYKALILITSNNKLQITDQLQSLPSPPPTATDAPDRDRAARRHVASGASIFLFIKFAIPKLANLQSSFSSSKMHLQDLQFSNHLRPSLAL